MKASLLTLAMVLAAPVAAAPLPSSENHQLLLNFDLTATKGTATFQSVAVDILFAQHSPSLGISYDIYGGANGQGFISQITFADGAYGSNGSNREIQFQTANPIYAPLNDGIFSIGLWQANGSADLVSAKASGVVQSALGFSYAGFVAGTVAVVPEPATWAMMVAGFGLAATGMRRNRALRRHTA